MERPRIRHIAINTQDRDAEAEYYKKHFGLEEKMRGPNGTVYLSDGFVDIALINNPSYPWGINHFGFVVDSVEAVQQSTQAELVTNTPGAVAESWLRDPEGNRVDVSEEGWPV